MRNIVFVGQGLGRDKCFGIHRNTTELLRCIDRMAAPGQITVALPSNEESNLHFQNIDVIQIGKNFNKFGHIGERITYFLYRNWYIKRFAQRKRALTVDMVLVFPHFGCDVISIYDCIPDKFPQYYTNRQSRISREKNCANSGTV